MTTAKLIVSNLRIYSIIFREVKATLKLGSARSLIRVGKKFLAIFSAQELVLFAKNLFCNSSIAYKRTFQSLSFFKSSINFLPTATSFFSLFDNFISSCFLYYIFTLLLKEGSSIYLVLLNCFGTLSVDSAFFRWFSSGFSLIGV